MSYVPTTHGRNEGRPGGTRREGGEASNGMHGANVASSTVASPSSASIHTGQRGVGRSDPHRSSFEERKYGHESGRRYEAGRPSYGYGPDRRNDAYEGNSNRRERDHYRNSQHYEAESSHRRRSPFQSRHAHGEDAGRARPYETDEGSWHSRGPRHSGDYGNRGYNDDRYAKDRAYDRAQARRGTSPGMRGEGRRSPHSVQTLDYGTEDRTETPSGNKSQPRSRAHDQYMRRSRSPTYRDQSHRSSALVSPRGGRHHDGDSGYHHRQRTYDYIDNPMNELGSREENGLRSKTERSDYREYNDSPPVKTLKRKSSPVAQRNEEHDAKRQGTTLSTIASNLSQDETVMTTVGNDTASSDFRHSQIESAAPTATHFANGVSTSTDRVRSIGTPRNEDVEQRQTMIDRACPWPFEVEGSHNRRVRKKERPSLRPLKERRFVGCSSIDQYDLGVKLGQGTFGEVKKATHFLTGVEVALKKVTIHEEKDGMPITAIREIKLLKRLHHPSIVPIIDMAYRAPTERGKVGEVYMVEPYMDHDLNGMLENSSIVLNMSQIKLYMKQLFEGTLYLHQNKILHRDMKAANLLINNKGQLQIADFGLARPFHDPGRAWEASGWKGGAQSYTGMVVTRWYRPPELLAGDRKYGPPIDMWGLGCILAEMIVKQPIFKGTSEIDQMVLISKLCGSPNETSYPGWNALPGVKNADPNGRPDQEPDVPGQHDFGTYPRRVVEHFTSGGIVISSDMADLIDKLLVLDPRKRMTAQEALEHRWFWQSPFPADPAAMPQYQASKELDRQRRDHHKRMQQQQQAQHRPSHHPPPPQMQSMYGAGGGQQSYGNARPSSYGGSFKSGPSRPYPASYSQQPYGSGGGHPAPPRPAMAQHHHHRHGNSHSASQTSTQQPFARSTQASNPYTDL